MIILTPAVLSVLYACVLYFCICTCSAQVSMFHMERRSRNMLIIIIIIIIIMINTVVYGSFQLSQFIRLWKCFKVGSASAITDVHIDTCMTRLLQQMLVWSELKKFWLVLAWPRKVKLSHRKLTQLEMIHKNGTVVQVRGDAKTCSHHIQQYRIYVFHLHFVFKRDTNFQCSLHQKKSSPLFTFTSHLIKAHAKSSASLAVISVHDYSCCLT